MPKTEGALGLRITAAVAVTFGLLTIMEGGTVLFGSEASRVAAGQFVPFVLWFNFLWAVIYTFSSRLLAAKP